MRAFNYIFLILLLNICMAIVSQIGYLNVTKEYSEEWFTDIGNLTYDIKVDDDVSLGSSDFGFAELKEFLFGFGKILSATFIGVVWFPKNLQAFGVSGNLVVYLSVIYYFIFLIGIIQFISNRSSGGME